MRHEGTAPGVTPTALKDRFLGPEQGLRFGNVHTNPLLYLASGGDSDPLLQVGKPRLKGRMSLSQSAQQTSVRPQTGAPATTTLPWSPESTPSTPRSVSPHSEVPHQDE